MSCRPREQERQIIKLIRSIRRPHATGETTLNRACPLRQMLTFSPLFDGLALALAEVTG
jgi:hypothetical protein